MTDAKDVARLSGRQKGVVQDSDSGDTSHVLRRAEGLGSREESREEG